MTNKQILALFVISLLVVSLLGFAIGKNVAFKECKEILTTLKENLGKEDSCVHYKYARVIEYCPNDLNISKAKVYYSEDCNVSQISKFIREDMVYYDGFGGCFMERIEG